MVSTPEPILLVEDDADIAVSLKARLEAAGYDVTVERCGTDALTHLRESQPALVILDVQLPDVDGYAVCEVLRHRDESEAIPVVMFTVMDDPEDEARGRAAGANAYLSKDQDVSTLLRTVDDLLAHPLPQ